MLAGWMSALELQVLRWIPLLLPFILMGTPGSPVAAVGVYQRFGALAVTVWLWSIFVGLVARLVRQKGRVRHSFSKFSYVAVLLIFLVLVLGALHYLRSYTTTEEFAMILAMIGLRALSIGGESRAGRMTPLAAQGIADLLLCVITFRLYLLGWDWRPWIVGASFASVHTAATAVEMMDQGPAPRALGRRFLGEGTAVLFLLAPLLILALFYFGQLPRRFALICVVYPFIRESVMMAHHYGNGGELPLRARSMARRSALFFVATFVLIAIW